MHLKIPKEGWRQAGGLDRKGAKKKKKNDHNAPHFLHMDIWGDLKDSILRR
jgi:hypothetical protein